MSIALQRDFFDCEIRNGYFVSEKMKKVWAVQLDLLDQFSRVCEQNNLQYFLDGGTLLGAVRHNGFIPWDDDVDVIMPRCDYDRLCAIAHTVFQPPYFFQTALTENGLFRAHAQLRNSNTTGYIADDAKKDINKGIFLDIFILDGLPSSRASLFLQKNKILLFRKIFWLTFESDYNTLSASRKIAYCVFHWTFHFFPYHKQYHFFDQKILARYSRKDTEMIGDLTLGWNENTHWKKEWFANHTYLPFENLYLRVPIGYHEILTKQYGEYMQLPPESQRKNNHGEIFLDPETPYSCYFSKSKV